MIRVFSEPRRLRVSGNIVLSTYLRSFTKVSGISKKEEVADNQAREERLLPEEKWDEDIGIPRKSESDKLIFPEYGNKPKGMEPTKFGDWQYKGRATDY